MTSKEKKRKKNNEREIINECELSDKIANDNNDVIETKCNISLDKQMSLYGDYLPDEKYIDKLEEKLKTFIPNDLIEKAKKESNGESWIIAFGYNEDAFTSRSNWFKTEPYPFITSDGKTYIDMYREMLKKDENGNNQEILNINSKNFITAFNKNKDKCMNENGNYILDKEKRLFKTNYPNVDDYEFVYIKHISYYD